MHLAPLIRDLAIILATAGVVALIFQRIRQPVVLGYLVAGLIVGPHTPPFPMVKDIPNIKTLAELGVIFLMFSLGLEFSFRKLARVGVSAGFTACFEVLVMIALGFGTAMVFGWSVMDGIFLGAILSISSTTIIIKALDELNLKTRRFAEIIFGVLIVEDLIAILILVALTTLVSAESFSGMVLAQSAAKLALVIGSWFLTGYFVLPRFIRYVGKFRSDETLTIISVGLCLSLVAFAAYFEYSAALGAFIMGSILAETTESHRIEEMIKPLRDLFAAIFFVSVGMLIDPMAIWEHKGAVLAITAVTIVGKLMSTTIGPLLSGQSLKTSVLVGFGLAQIGEFSFIIAGLGLSLGIMSDFLYPIAVAVSLVTTFTTPYMIRYSPKIAEALEKILPASVLHVLERYRLWLERRSTRNAPDPELNKLMLRWMLNGFLVTVIWVLVAELAMPIIETLIDNRVWSIALGWIGAILLSAPFIWAMLSVLLVRHENAATGLKRHPTAFLIMQLVTLLWFAILSLSYFPARYVGIITAALGMLLFTRLYRQLGASYHWFEEGFTEVFKGAEKSEPSRDVFFELAPWDEHLVRLKVHADSAMVGKCLAEMALRSRYNVNVVAIQRGARAIVAPAPDQPVFPKDELLVLGKDEQIDQVRHLIEKSSQPTSFVESIAGYELRHFAIDDDSPLLGRSIRQSAIREEFGALVVGIERRGRRIMNPDSDMVIEIHDGLWIVGLSEKLDELFRKCALVPK